MDSSKYKSLKNAILVILFIFFTNSRAQNIILFISDGCGYNHVDAASIYQFGERNKQVYHSFPVQYAMSTYSLDNPEYDPEQAWQTFEYVLNKPTDSAASGTALASGIKTYNGRIGVDSTDNSVKNAVEHFESLGKSTGVVTSVMFTHATPASFVAHNESRKNYSAIAREMIMESSVDVIMGCGHPYYDKKGNTTEDIEFDLVGGEEVWEELLAGKAGSDADGDGKTDYWTLIDERSDFQKLMRGDAPSRLIGIPKVRGTLQADREGDTGADAFAVPFNSNVPALQEMTRAAINVLDDNDNGFFLMVEGGAIDWASHDNSAGRMIEEEIEFNAAVQAAVDWVNTNSSWDETTVIVTGDHETGYLTGPGSNNPDEPHDLWKPLINNGAGNMPGTEWHTDGHTNSLIPFFAKGAYADAFEKYAVKNDPVRGLYIDNSNVGMVLLSITD